MLSVKNIKCPYCNKTSYFEESMTQGYCSYCGRIIYSDISSEKISVKQVSTAISEKHVEHNITFNYTRKTLSGYSPSVMILIDNKQKVVATSGKPCLVIIEEGDHYVVVQCHITSGVNSTDIAVSENIKVLSNLRYNIRCGGGFFHNIFLEKAD